MVPKFKVAVRKSGNASVINIVSIYGMVSPNYGIYFTTTGTNSLFYCAGKAASIIWTKYVACEFAKGKMRFSPNLSWRFPV